MAVGYQADRYKPLTGLNELNWIPLGDPVMGGRSEGSATSTPEEWLSFQGIVRLDNGGGFASVKADLNEAWDLSGWEGIRLRVKGDGRYYKLGLRLNTNRNSPVYQHRFATEPGQWQWIYMAFRDFEPRLRGKKRPDAPPLDPACIRSLSLFVSERQEGGFQVLLSCSNRL